MKGIASTKNVFHCWKDMVTGEYRWFHTETLRSVSPPFDDPKAACKWMQDNVLKIEVEV